MRDLTLLYFCKPHCAPCEVQWPKAQALAEAWKVPLVKLDVTQPGKGQYVTEFKLRAVPTVVLVDSTRTPLISASGDAIDALPMNFSPTMQCCRGGEINDDCCTA